METLQALAKASLLRGDDDLLAALHPLGFQGVAQWLLLAIAHRTAGNHAQESRVYAKIREADKKQALYSLRHARALRDADLPLEALDAYDAFLATHDNNSASFQLIVEQQPQAERPEWASSDPDHAAALLESGEIFAQLERWEEAAQRYLDLIREAPYEERGYARLFTLVNTLAQVSAPMDLTMRQAWMVLGLLRPEARDNIAAHAMWEPKEPQKSPPARYCPLVEETYTGLLHPAERNASAMAQKWMGEWLSSTPETGDIERHCQRISSQTHPELKEILTHTSHLLGIVTPRCYLSHGTTGIGVFDGGGDPFVLLGTKHVEPDHERYLPPAQLRFAVASQLAHIKAGHLLLTQSEFWSAFGNRALDGLMTALTLIPAASWIGKFTDVFALRWLAGLQAQFQSKVMLQALSVVEEQIKQGAATEGAWSALGGLLGKFRAEEGGTKLDNDTLVKESLASFARGALYSADRVGLLVCDDLEAAVEAMFRLSPRAIEEIPSIGLYGLAHVLSRRNADGALHYQEMALRLGELFKFALSEDYQQLRAQILGHKEPEQNPKPSGSTH